MQVPAEAYGAFLPPIDVLILSAKALLRFPVNKSAHANARRPQSLTSHYLSNNRRETPKKGQKI